MFQSFTGSSRRPRQVNLSGRNTNPFASVGPGTGSQAALASAQQERIQRQRERDRLNAARQIQRTWRGYSCRRRLRQELRAEWDRQEFGNGRLGPSSDGEDGGTYTSEEQSLSQLRLLLRFMNVQDDHDVERLHRYMARQMAAVRRGYFSRSTGPWPITYLRLQKNILSALEKESSTSSRPITDDLLLEELRFVVDQIPGQTAQNASQYYGVVAAMTRRAINDVLKDSQNRIKTTDATTLTESLVTIIAAPLRTMTADTPNAYQSFAFKILTLSRLGQDRFPLLQTLAEEVNPKLLAKTLSSVVSRSDLSKHQGIDEAQKRLNLLAHFIYLHRHTYNFRDQPAYTSETDFVTVVSNILSSIADEVNLEAPDMDPFVQEQVLSLVNQESVRNLLSRTGPSYAPAQVAFSQASGGSPVSNARQFAHYALTLLRCFPRRADDIRMWLYLGSSATSGSAIRYFWRASQSTTVFNAIKSDSRAAITLLKPAGTTNSRRGIGGWQAPKPDRTATDDEWRITLIFMELYVFVLKVMDDDEFFSQSGSTSSRENALPLNEIKDLTTFLKNLGFTMYFNASEISSAEERNTDMSGISNYFTVSSRDSPGPSQAAPTPNTVAGLTGMSIDHVKGLVTGLLRMLYERDSRRPFLPKDHWLMTSRFDMEGFIPAVVAEEESRHKVQEEDDQDVDQDKEEDSPSDTPLIGTRRTQQTRNLERLRRQQRKASRKRYLQAVAPRLEILQNMPFFIPFATRVQIFREFVHLDQLKRRNGFVDPDQWRMSIMHTPFARDQVERHHAKIRRKHEFEDAYEAFYNLKEGLKEPIQITFVDQFDTVEAGIDGGGVTKEFLTSVTSQAFSPSDGLNMFVENDQHLLYPNPAAIDEQKEILRQAGMPPHEATRHITDLLQRYEFLGRVIGKCLYEGILVDINFAPFFLLKWALTGGAGAAPKESGYRASINDLRDLDQELYQGLLQLKNYPGDVEDFSLNFTVTDTIYTDPKTGATKTVTRDLMPNGSVIPVTNENRLVYISYMARYRLQIQPLRQTNAFLRGLSSMIQPSWLSMFNQSELQTLIGGTSSSIDVPDLRRNTQYGGVYVIGDDGQEHPSIKLFWRVMEGLKDQERRAVLKFVTSTPRAPLLGFASLNPRFSIRDAGDDQERLPSTSTCVNLLKLPRYKDERILREKLLYAVNSGAGFDLS